MIFSCFGTFRELAVLFRGTQRGINKGIVGTCNIIRELFNDKTVLDTINQVRFFVLLGNFTWNKSPDPSHYTIP